MNKYHDKSIPVHIAIYVACLILLMSCASPANIDNSSGQSINSPGAQALDQILKVVHRIRQIEASHRGRPLDHNTRGKIDEELKQIKKPRDLSTLALICRAIEDYEYDFGIAFQDCVDLLAEDTSDDGVDQLIFLMQRVQPESGDKQLFDEAIAHQKEKRGREKKE